MDLMRVLKGMRSQLLIGPWSPLWRHVLKMELCDTLLPPPKASLKLMAARGTLNTTLPSARVSAARLVIHALLCS